MKFSLYEWAWNNWYKRAKKRAMRDPEYAAEELGRQKGCYFIGSGDGYTLEGLWAHMDRFHELCPSPWWVKVHHWRDKHRLRFRMKYNDLKHFIQRGKRGYADCDLWSFDTYLSDVISKALLELRDTAYSYPSELESFEEWQDILTEISEGFAQDKFDYDGFDNEKFDKAMALFVKYFYSMWN